MELYYMQRELGKTPSPRREGKMKYNKVNNSYRNTELMFVRLHFPGCKTFN